MHFISFYALASLTICYNILYCILISMIFDDARWDLKEFTSWRIVGTLLDSFRPGSVGKFWLGMAGWWDSQINQTMSDRQMLHSFFSAVYAAGPTASRSSPATRCAERDLVMSGVQATLKRERKKDLHHLHRLQQVAVEDIRRQYTPNDRKSVLQSTCFRAQGAQLLSNCCAFLFRKYDSSAHFIRLCKRPLRIVIV